MQSIDLVPSLGAIMGFSPAQCSGQTDQGTLVAMLPRNLQPEHFAAYPPEARKVVRRSPRCPPAAPRSPFFPACCARSSSTITNSRRSARRSIRSSRTSALSRRRKQRLVSSRSTPFRSLELEHFDWINLPAQFVEQQSAYLWSTHQLDAFRKAATDYGARLQAAVPAGTAACAGSASRSSARAFQHTTSRCFATCVRTAPTSTR